jgi:hypothetical protein
MLQPINKHTVLKEVRMNGAWEGVVAPNNFNVNGVWGHGMDLLITVSRDKKYYVINRYNNSPITADYEELETVLNSFAYYNCHGELGKRIRFWHDVK